MKCPYCQNENEVEIKQTEFFTGWIVKCFGCGLTSPQMKEKHEAVSLWYRIRFVSEGNQMNVEVPRERDMVSTPLSYLESNSKSGDMLSSELLDIVQKIKAIDDIDIVKPTTERERIKKSIRDRYSI